MHIHTEHGRIHTLLLLSLKIYLYTQLYRQKNKIMYKYIRKITLTHCKIWTVPMMAAFWIVKNKLLENLGIRWRWLIQFDDTTPVHPITTGTINTGILYITTATATTQSCLSTAVTINDSYRDTQIMYLAFFFRLCLLLLFFFFFPLFTLAHLPSSKVFLL